MNTNTNYHTISNSNYDHDDEIVLAAKAIKNGWTENEALLDAMADLEATLADLGDEQDIKSIQECEDAEWQVREAFTQEVQEEIEAVKQSQIRD